MQATALLVFLISCFVAGSLSDGSWNRINPTPTIAPIGNIVYGKDPNGKDVYVATGTSSHQEFIYSNDGKNWKQPEIPKEASLGAATYGSGYTVVYGGSQYGFIAIAAPVRYVPALRSQDGVKWEIFTITNSSLPGDFGGYCQYGANTFVCAGNFGIYSSSDFGTWTRTFDGIEYTNWVNGLHWDDASSQFYASIAPDSVLSSSDGMNWNVLRNFSLIFPNTLLRDVFTYHRVGQTEVALTQTGAQLDLTISTSTDGGKTWFTSYTYPTLTIFGYVVYAQNLWFMSGYLQTESVFTILVSPNGVNWKPYTNPIGAVQTVNNMFFATTIYEHFQLNKVLQYSTDGQNWNLVDTGLNVAIDNVMYSPDKDKQFVLSTSNGVYVSGSNLLQNQWTLATSRVFSLLNYYPQKNKPFFGALTKMNSGASYNFTSVTTNFADIVYYSGFTLGNARRGSSVLGLTTNGQGTWVATAMIFLDFSYSAFIYSTNSLASDFLPVQSFTEFNNGITNVVFGNGVFVTLAVDQIYSSNDGVHWTSTYTMNTQYLNVYQVCEAFYTGVPSTLNPSTTGRFYVYCSPGVMEPLQLVTSTDGKNWTPVTLPQISGFIIGGITFLDNQYIILGSYGTVLTSSDGVTWTQTSNINSQSTFNWIVKSDDTNPIYLAVSPGDNNMYVKK